MCLMIWHHTSTIEFLFMNLSNSVLNVTSRSDLKCFYVFFFLLCKYSLALEINCTALLCIRLKNNLTIFGKRVLVWSHAWSLHECAAGQKSSNSRNTIVISLKRECRYETLGSVSQGRDKTNHVVLIGYIHTDVVDKCCSLWQLAYPPFKQSRLCTKTDSTMKNISLIRSCIFSLNVWSET